MGITRITAGKPSVLERARRLGFGRNPLRRRVDRIESVIVLCAIVLALLMIPVAAAAGTAVRRHNDAVASARRATLGQVEGRTLEAAPAPVGESQTRSLVRVAWFDPAGVRREGRTDVPIGTSAGSEVTLWLDRSGAITAAPGSSADSTASGTVAGLGVLIATWPLIFGLTRLAVVPLDRRRMRNWDRAWQQIAPRRRHHQE